MKCQLCRERSDLIEAHVVPAGFFRRMPSDQGPARILTNNPRDFPKRAPVGVYDPSILCSSCEARFGPWDKHAQDVLTDDVHNAVIRRVGDKVVGYEIQDYEYKRLKLFFVSLAWRASVSKHAFYRRIRLGPFEDRARRMILTDDPGAEQEFGVTLARFDTQLWKVTFDPHPEKWSAVNYIRFYLAGYVAYIKTDRRSAPKPMSDFLLGSSPPLKIVAREFLASSEASLARRIVQQPQNARGRQDGAG